MSDERVVASYDAVARTYAERVGGEMAHKPIDRAWLGCLIELAGKGRVADVGCGPGHVTAWLAEQGADTIGIDVSPGMISVARKRYPGMVFEVGSLLELPVRDGGWAAAVCPYSIIHLTARERPVAFAELARAVRPGGWLLLSFHISGPEHRTGQTEHLTRWWDHDVDLDFHYLDPEVISGELAAAGFIVMAVAERGSWPGVEAPTRRCHLLAQAATAPTT